MQDFRQLSVWRKGHALTLAVYRATQDFPRAELYGLTSQLRRAVSAIPTNIAEGAGRGSDADFGRFLQIAMGSANETAYLLLLARDLTYISDDAYASLDSATAEIKRMLASLLRTLRDPGSKKKLTADS